MIWLAGLISTDGCIAPHGNGCQINAIATVEEDWAILVTDTLNQAGIPAKIHAHKNSGVFSKAMLFTVFLPNPSEIIKLLSNKELKPFFNPRKWRMIEKYNEFYTSSRYRKRQEWNEKTDETFIALCKQRPFLPDGVIAEKMKRSRSSIAFRRVTFKIPVYRHRSDWALWKISEKLRSKKLEEAEYKVIES